MMRICQDVNDGDAIYAMHSVHHLNIYIITL